MKSVNCRSETAPSFPFSFITVYEHGDIFSIKLTARKAFLRLWPECSQPKLRLNYENIIKITLMRYRVRQSYCNLVIDQLLGPQRSFSYQFNNCYSKL